MNSIDEITKISLTIMQKGWISEENDTNFCGFKDEAIEKLLNILSYCIDKSASSFQFIWCK